MLHAILSQGILFLGGLDAQCCGLDGPCITHCFIAIVSLWLWDELVPNTSLRHPAETSKNSDIYDFLKVSDIGKSILLNGETYILNDTAQFSEHMREIYIWKNLLKYGHPNYIETFMD